MLPSVRADGQRLTPLYILGGMQDLVEMDFVQGYLDFNDLSVGIPSIGFHIKLKDYWDGQCVAGSRSRLARRP
jgi:hypothetical protein